MPKPSKMNHTSTGLRQRAEQNAGKRAVAAAMPKTEADTRRLLHELEVHQIELDMQNKELRIARDEAEELLEKYTNLYDFAPVGYFTLAPDGTILLVNLTGSVLFGVERSKLRGRNFGTVLAPDQRAGFKAFLNRVFSGAGEQTDDFRINRKEAIPRIVNIEARRAVNGLECSAIVVDISGRKWSEEKVRVSEIRYRRLFEAAHDGVLLLDPETCKITDANPFMTVLLGYPREQLIGKELFEIGLLKDEPASRKMFRKLKVNHEVRYEDLPLESKSGHHQEVEVVANLYQEDGHSVIQCNIRDITARKNAANILRRNEALFSALIEQAPVGVYVIDGRFRLQQANPMAMTVFENVHPLIGRGFSEVIRCVWPKRVANQIIGHFQHTLETGEPYQAPGFVERRRDTGAKEVYEWQLQRVTLPAGELGVVCFFNNITERTKSESTQLRLDVLTAFNLKLKQEIARRQLVEEDLRSNRQELSQLLRKSRNQERQLRNLSHRMLHAQEEERKRVSRELHDVIAQALAGINVHLEGLNQGVTTDPAGFQQQIARTQSLVEKAVDTVHRFARELRPTMLDDLGLIPALKDFMEGFMKETGIRVSLNTTAYVEPPTMILRTVLYRIAQEALTNVARHSKASRAELDIECLDGVIRMKVSDNGQGFETSGTSARRKSNGLGLLGMRERVEMVGGTFKLQSARGKATSVQVEVPSSTRRTRKTSTPSPGKTHEPESPQGPTKTG
jgi:PAS domain S-box-containing protein